MSEQVLDALSKAPRVVFWIVSFGVLWALMSAAASVLAFLITAMSALGGVSITAPPLLIAAVIGLVLTGIVYLLIGWEVPR